MVVGVCEVELHIPGCGSLKQKRQVLRSLKDRLRGRFNVAVSETEHHDLWQRATLAIVTISNDAAVVHSILAHAERLVQGESRVELLDVHVELR
jgi:uncharacterized protein YlxP (DUF503 family)